MSALLKAARAMAPPPAAPLIKPLAKREKRENYEGRTISMAEDIQFRWYLVQFLRDFRSGARYGDVSSGQALRVKRMAGEPAAARLMAPSEPSAKRRGTAKAAAAGRNRTARHSSTVAQLRVPPFVAGLSGPAAAGEGQPAAV